MIRRHNTLFKNTFLKLTPQKLRHVAIVLCALTLSNFANADVLTFNIEGTLADGGLPLNNEYDFASFSGQVALNSDSLQTNTSSAVAYNLESYYIELVPSNPLGTTLLFNSDGEESEDDSSISIAKNDGIIVFNIFENIDNPNTVTLERMLMQLSFDANTTSRVDSIFELIEADNAFGQAANLSLGLLQFTTSQIPSTIATATASLDVPNDTPVPASAPTTLILLLASLGYIVVRKTR